MIAKNAKYLFMVICFLCPSFVFGGEITFKDQIIMTGSWGGGDGQFGKETLGKTELGFALDFTIYNGQIYVYDTMNNRIQIFDLSGKFEKKIPLDFDWIKQGVTWRFTILNSNFFALIAPPPYYSEMNADIYKISPDGKILKKFGSKQINKRREEYFSKIIASEKTREIYCSIAGSSRIAVYDFEGNFVKYLTDIKSAPQIILNSDGQVDKNALSYCSWMDGLGNCYKIWSKSSAKNNLALTTEIQIFPPNTKTHAVITHEFSGDIKSVKDGMERIIRYSGNYEERSFVDSESVIYHLIALDNGVVLRRIEWKEK